MKRPTVLLLILISFLFSCIQNSHEQYPSGILSKEKFTDLLKDCQLAESAINIKKLKQPNDNMYSRKLYKEVFKKHQITEDQFNANIDYYKDKPKELLQIYSDVVDSLSKIQSTMSQYKIHP